MKKTYLFLASLMVSLVSFAEWTKPAVPTAQALSVGTECYLYNTDAGGFLVGANDWGTRASYDATLGHKVIIEAGTVDGSYYLTNFVLSGWMANQWGYLFIEPDNLNSVYVDNTKGGKTNNQFTFVEQGNNVYHIGLSAKNTEHNSENLFLGGITEKNDTRLYFTEEGQLNWIFVSTADYTSYVEATNQYNAAIELGKVLAEANATNGTDAKAISDAKAVYDNSKSTVEELNAAAKALSEAVKMAKYNIATVENPVEVLSLLGIATDFSNGPTGWTSTTGAQNKGASNGNNAKDYEATGNHYENWHPNAFTPGKISATAEGIPAGIYRLSALAFSNTGRDAYLYAGDGRTAVTATQIDEDQVFTT